jgi:hypothetical protein
LLGALAEERLAVPNLSSDNDRLHVHTAEHGWEKIIRSARRVEGRFREEVMAICGKTVQNRVILYEGKASLNNTSFGR